MPEALTTEELQQAVDREAAYPTMQAAAVSLGMKANAFSARVRTARLAGLTGKRPSGKVEETPDLLRRKVKRLEGEISSMVKRLETHDDTLHVVKQLIHDCDEPITPPKWAATTGKGHTTGVPTLFLSDIHYDEVVLANQISHVNAFTRTIANRRLKMLFTKTLDLLVHHMANPKYEYFVLNLGGDCLSGLIHEELRETNECPIAQSIMALTDQLVAGITMLLEQFPRIIVNCVVGNHGRFDKKPRMKNRAYENYEWLLYQFVAKHFHEYRDIVFTIADGADCPYTIYSTRFLLTHGDQFKGGSGIAGALSPLMLGDARKRKRAIAIDQPFDYLLMGHWHTLWMAKGIIVNGSVKGYDEYAFQSNFDFEIPQQWMFITHPQWGITARWPIMLEAPGTKF